MRSRSGVIRAPRDSLIVLGVKLTGRWSISKASRWFVWLREQPAKVRDAIAGDSTARAGAAWKLIL